MLAPREPCEALSGFALLPAQSAGQSQCGAGRIVELDLGPDPPRPNLLDHAREHCAPIATVPVGGVHPDRRTNAAVRAVLDDDQANQLDPSQASHAS